jgi:hypothetical protein
MNYIERRQSPRLKIVGAHVIYKIDKGRYSLKQLHDISKIAARFDVDHKLELGDYLEIIIIIPKKKRIYLKCTIIRVSDPDSDLPPHVVVKFLPFKEDERYNSMKCYHQLHQLIDEYLLSEKLSKKIPLKPLKWKS